MGKYDLAVADYQQALRLPSPDTAPGEVYVNIGNAYSKAVDYDKALTAYQQALDAQPNDAEAYLGLAMTYTSKGDKAQAIAAYQKLLDLTAGSNNARYAQLHAQSQQMLQQLSANPK